MGQFETGVLPTSQDLMYTQASPEYAPPSIYLLPLSSKGSIST